MFTELKIINVSNKLYKKVYVGDYSSSDILKIIDFYTKHPLFSIQKL